MNLLMRLKLEFSLISHAHTLDYRREEVIVNWCLQVAWQFKPPICFPAVKQGLIYEYESDIVSIKMISMSESHWWHLFHNKA
jgi:hypothetical protein